jgi:hypothetical protein
MLTESAATDVVTDLVVPCDASSTNETVCCARGALLNVNINEDGAGGVANSVDDSIDVGAAIDDAASNDDDDDSTA